MKTGKQTKLLVAAAALQQRQLFSYPTLGLTNLCQRERNLNHPAGVGKALEVIGQAQGDPSIGILEITRPTNSVQCALCGTLVPEGGSKHSPPRREEHVLLGVCATPSLKGGCQKQKGDLPQ